MIDVIEHFAALPICSVKSILAERQKDLDTLFTSSPATARTPLTCDAAVDLQRP